MKCIACSNINLRDAPDMAIHGYGACRRGKAGEFRSVVLEVECRLFAESSAEDVSKRIEWLERKRK